MKKLYFIFALIFITSILVGYTYIYNTQTKQIFVNKNDITIKNEGSNILYYANDDIAIYLDNSDNIFSTFISTVNISTKELNNGITIYYYENGVIKSTSTYQVEQSTGT